ncbi:Presenilin-domain-containing protein [Obelidium mucronatum]|nr:Presenilin-domain-containing protein [Obelidium mucronatum]
MSANTTVNAVPDVEMGRVPGSGGTSTGRVCVVCNSKARFLCSVCSSVRYCSQSLSVTGVPTERLGNTPTAMRRRFEARCQLQTAKTEKSRHSRRPPQIKKNNSNSNNNNNPVAQELRFYLVQIYMILKPVVICITLSVLWMKLTNPPKQFFDRGVGSIHTQYLRGRRCGCGGGGYSCYRAKLRQDLTSALIIISQIIVATVIIYLLFRYNCMKILYGFFGLIVLGLLGMFGYVLGTTLLSTYEVAFDYISFFFLLWNLAGVGLVAIFWKGPLMLQQAYMVFMSTLMALSLSSLPAITSWILLSLLAVWDLIAVLCPYGPLRLLIENSQQNNREIPALLYTAPIPAAAGVAASAAITANNQPTYIQGPSEFLQATSNEKEESIFTTESLKSSTIQLTDGNASTAHIIPRAAVSPCATRGDCSTTNCDFVFYSVLSSRAALLDWVSTMTVIIAVITGLNATIFLLVLFQKALPALPISIMFGLLFYFVSYLTLVPFVNQMTSMPDRLNVSASTVQGSALWAGRNGGAGLIYV